MKKILLLIAGISLVAAACTQQSASNQETSGTQQTTSEVITYVNDQYGFKLQHPTDLEVRTDASSTFSFIDRNGNTVISLIVSGPETAGLPPTRTTTINGNEVKVYDTENEIMYSLGSDSSVYTFESQDSSAAIIENILTTFRFTK